MAEMKVPSNQYYRYKDIDFTFSKFNTMILLGLVDVMKTKRSISADLQFLHGYKLSL